MCDTLARHSFSPRTRRHRQVRYCLRITKYIHTFAQLLFKLYICIQSVPAYIIIIYNVNKCGHFCKTSRKNTTGPRPGRRCTFWPWESNRHLGNNILIIIFFDNGTHVLYFTFLKILVFCALNRGSSVPNIKTLYKVFDSLTMIHLDTLNI